MTTTRTLMSWLPSVKMMRKGPRKPGAGCQVVLTVSVTALVVADPKLFVKTARYCLPESAAFVVNEYVVDVAPLMSLQVVPLSVLSCHCTEGDGHPLAAVENDAVRPAVID